MLFVRLHQRGRLETLTALTYNRISRTKPYTGYFIISNDPTSSRPWTTAEIMGQEPTCFGFPRLKRIDNCFFLYAIPKRKGKFWTFHPLQTTRRKCNVSKTLSWTPCRVFHNLSKHWHASPPPPPTKLGVLAKVAKYLMICYELDFLISVQNT